MRPRNISAYPSLVSVILLPAFLFLFSLPGVLAATTEMMVPFHVQKGTNLIRIARQYCRNPSDWKTIAAINRLADPYIIYADSTIKVPLSILRTKMVSARVISIKGAPLLVSGQDTTRQLHKGDTVLPGQTVVTRDDEYVHLVYPDNKHSRIGPGSKMLLVYLMRLADNNLQAEFFLNRGRMTNAIERKLKANEHFRTRTPMAITGIRGTEFRLKVEDAETNIVETLRGRVALSAAGKEVIIGKGQGSMVKKGKPPEPPHALPPRPKIPELPAVYRMLPVVIPTPSRNNIRSMHLRVTTDRQGMNTLTEQTVAAGKKFSLSSLADGSYFLFLTATDQQGFESPPAGPAVLRIRTSPGAPIISSPESNRKFFTPTLKVRWLKSELADHYTLQLATDPDFTHLVDTRQTTKDFYVTPELKPGKYFFRVQLTTDDGFATLFSVPVSWQIMARPKLAGLDIAPGGQDGKTTLRWPAMADMAGYMIQIATDKEFNDLIVEDDNLKNPSYTIDSQLVNGKYYVRIRSITKDGLQSPWTPPQVMTIDVESSWLPHATAVLAFIALAIIL